jgi:hypothetical protein
MGVRLGQVSSVPRGAGTPPEARRSDCRKTLFLVCPSSFTVIFEKLPGRKGKIFSAPSKRLSSHVFSSSAPMGTGAPR